MKRILLPAILMAVALLTSCNTTQKLYEAQEYDQVIMKVGHKASIGNVNLEEIEMLTSAYHRANQADHERILQLKATGQPDVWSEVYERYKSMNGRQKVLASLPKEVKSRIQFTQMNLDDELQGAKNKAESYLVAKIHQLLPADTTADILQAKKLTRQLTNVNPQNPHIIEYQLMALLRGASQLRTEFADDHHFPISKRAEEALLRFDEDELSRIPLGVSKARIPVTMFVEITDLMVTPNKDETATFKETTGNLTATVTDHALTKSATMKAKLSFFYKDPDNMEPGGWNVLTLPEYEVTSRFNYTYSTVEGDRNACTEQTLENVKRQAIPFPTDESMVMDAAREMNDLFAKTLAK